MSTKKYNLAIVGYGGMGGWHNYLLKERCRELNVCGAYDINAARIKEAERNGLKTYENLDALLNDNGIDIVLIATPNDSHAEIAIKAMNAKKHVICEKPVAMNSNELQEILDAQKKTGMVFSVHQNRRWDPDFNIVEKMYNEKTLGDIFKIEHCIYGSRGFEGWRQKKAHGGGMLLDWGVHIIDQMLSMIEEKIKYIHCSFTNILYGEVDDSFSLHLTFESGLTAVLEASACHFIRKPLWLVAGNNGTAVIEDWDVSGKIIKLESFEDENVKAIEAGAGLTKTMAPRDHTTITELALPKVKTDSMDFFRNVIGQIEKTAKPIVKNEEVMRVMKVMEAAFLSAETNTVVNFE